MTTSVVTLSELLAARVHLGHRFNKWNPKMVSFIYAERNKVHIIDLVQTAFLLGEACDYVKLLAKKGKKFLFVGTRQELNTILAEEAERCNSFYINQRWLGGLLTNWVTIKSRVQALEKKESEGFFNSLPKKESARLKKELDKLRRYFNGIRKMNTLPDVVIIIDQRKDLTAVQECNKLNIPTICIVDTNCNPDIVDLPIPANDDAICSVKLILGKLVDFIKEGQIERELSKTS
uniref:Small ribosomal subunit protein uS2c n=1 Tax=Galdieria sulphuraria TaxID=130081 RepID=RR2_GALSU|nr:RecName: Full=Small ribosomal subunit protein uS2c; AltName: Full=30S ribosomal protein S2, chloroplastic [Galdieria sulphuraria]pir/S39513/ ribosomal protein S2, chloroplast - red alga (Cyanidium caldarium) chloroplast [Cyanidium caldarium]CAA48018.1 ribosomal protein 2 [Galdieria sulphuraria]